MKWRSMKNAPKDGTLILVGCWVQHTQQPEPHWEVYLARWDDSGIVNQAYEHDLPWEWDDFDKWANVPVPPTGELA